MSIQVLKLLKNLIYSLRKNRAKSIAFSQIYTGRKE
jgi:hypothetical protein